MNSLTAWVLVRFILIIHSFFYTYTYSQCCFLLVLTITTSFSPPYPLLLIHDDVFRHNLTPPPPSMFPPLCCSLLSGKRTNAALEGFGAKRVYDYGEGDDSGTMEEDFAAWQSQVIYI